MRWRRASRHVKLYPDDYLVAQATLEAIELNAACARESAEMAMGHDICADDWRRVSEHWERVWQGIR
jgi:hypothetical protein